MSWGITPHKFLRAVSFRKLRSFQVGFSGDNRVQVPRLVRWRHKLEHGEALYLRIENKRSYNMERFYVKLSKGGRFTIPEVVMEALEAEAGYLLETTLYRIQDE